MLKRIATSTFAIMCAFSIENYGIATILPSTPEQWAEYHANPNAWAEKYGPKISKIEPVDQSTVVAAMPKPNQSNPPMQPIQTMQAAPVATSMPAKPRIGTVVNPQPQPIIQSTQPVAKPVIGTVVNPHIQEICPSWGCGSPPMRPVPVASPSIPVPVQPRIGTVIQNPPIQQSPVASPMPARPRIGTVIMPNQSNPPMQAAPVTTSIPVQTRIGIPMQPAQVSNPPMQSGQPMQPPALPGNDERMRIMNDQHMYQERINNRYDEKSNRSMSPESITRDRMMNTQNTQNVMQGKMVPPEQRRTAGNGAAYNQ